MKNSFYSYLLVTGQFAALAGIALTGSLIARHPLLLLVEMIALCLGGWAIIVMRIGSFNIIPDVKPEASLVVRGPYKLLRHPMYTSLLAAVAALVADYFSILRLCVGIVLTVVLVAKLNHEETLLKKAFAGYDEYMKTTYRLIPFVY